MVVLILAAQGRLTLVLFYPVSVFLSLPPWLVPGSFSYREGKRRSLIGNLVSALVVAVVLVINLARVTPSPL
jgi:hypothetical protein